MNRQIKAQIYLVFGSQKAFADRLGNTELEVSQVVCGRKALPPKEQARWAQYLNAKRESLFEAPECQAQVCR